MRFPRILLVSLGLLSGCSVLGYRTEKPELPGKIRSLYIPVFANDTRYSGLDFEATDEVQKEFRQRGGSPLKTAEEADGILEGRVIEYTRAVLSFDPQGRELERQVVVNCAFRLRTQKGKTVYEETLLASATYRADLGQGEADARRAAFQEMARRVALALIDRW